MEQIKYIVYSLLILVGSTLTYSIMKPILQTPLILAKTTKLVDGSNDIKEPIIKNRQGKSLFSANCQTCHAITKNLTGPALADVESRGPWTERENLVKWMKNPAAFIPTTKYTADLAAQYNGQVMPSFPQLSEADVVQIFDYIKEASAQPPRTSQ